ncbi:MAG TPA: DNA-3-methyladenine glycosylase [Pyrinomonadaceae bacterium]
MTFARTLVSNTNVRLFAYWLSAIRIPKYMTVTKRLSRKRFLTEDTLSEAKAMLGNLLVVPDEGGRRVSGMIVEVEAYCGVSDRGAHSYGGRRTARNEVTYGPGGHAYVFFVYGMYYQLNFVLGPAEHPHVLLIRAVEPVEGIDMMRLRRGAMKDKNLTSGPGKLCIALGIDRSMNGEDLVEGERVWVEKYGSFHGDEIAVGKRIGIDYAGGDADLPWRFWVKGNPYVSKR